MSTLANLVIRLTTDTSGLEAGMQSASRSLQSAGSAMTSVGQAASIGVTAPLLAAGGAAMVMGKNFDEAMANVGALGVATGRVQELKGAVQSTSVLVGESTVSMAQGLYQVVSAFGDSAESADLLRINAMAAKAGLASTSEAIALTSAVTKAYGDTSASAVGQVADLALQTVSLGQTTFPELAASMGRVTPIASSMGVSMEELFGFMATFSGVTGSAAEVSTQLRGAMQSLMAPTEGMQSIIEGLGFKTGQAAVENLGLANVLRAVVEQADATGVPLQQYIGSIEGQTLALALANGQSDTFDQKLAQMADSAGKTAEAFAAQTEGVNATGFSMEQAGIQVQVLAERLWDGLAPSVGRVLDMVAPLIDRATQLAAQFQELDPKTQTLILGALAMAAAFGPIAIVAGQVVTAIGAIIGVLGAILGPLTLVIAAGAALYLAWTNNWFGIRDVVQNAVALIMGYVGQLRDVFEAGGLQGVLARVREDFMQLVPPEVTTALGNLRERATEIWRMIADFFAPTLERLRSGFTDMLGSLTPVGGKLGELGEAAGRLVQALAPVVAVVGGALVAAFNLLLEIVAGVMPRMGEIIGGVVEAITSIIDGLAGVIKGLVDLVVALVHGDWTEAWEAAQDIVFSLVDGVIGAVTGLGTAVVALVGGLVDGVVEWFRNLYQTLVGGSIVPDMIAEIIAVFAGLPGRVIAFVADLVGTVIGKFNDLKGQAASAASSMASTVISRFNELKGTAISHASSMASTVISRFNELKGTAISHASAMAATVISRFNELKGTAISHASALASTVIGKFNELRSQAGSIISQMVSTIMGWLMALRDQALTLVATLVANIVSAFQIDWGSIGSGIVNGVIGGVRAAAGALAAAAMEVVQAALNAARAALGIHSPSTVAAQELGVPFTQGIAQGVLDAMGWLVDAVSTVAGQVETTGVREFAEAARAIAEAVGPAMEAVVQLSEAILPDGGGLDGAMEGFVAILQSFVEHLAEAATLLGSDAIAAAVEMGEAIGPITEPIEQGMAGLLSLGNLGQVNGRTIDAQMAAFADIMGGLTQHMRRVAGYFTADMLAAAVAFGEAIGPITEPIEQGMAALLSLGNLSQVNGRTIDAQMAAFADIIGGLTQHMRRVSDYFTADMLAAAAAFGAAIGPITEPIEKGVGALVALSGLAQVDGSRISDRMNAFADIMGGLVGAMRRVSGYFTEDMLAAAAAFAQAVDEVVKPIEGGVKALTALANASWGSAVLLTARIGEFADLMAVLAREMGLAAGRIQNETVAAAQVFAAAVGEVVKPVEAGVKALVALANAAWGDSLTLVARMVEFSIFMGNLASTMGTAAGRIEQETVTAAVRFATAVNDVVKPVETGVKALVALSQMSVGNSWDLLAKMIEFSGLMSLLAQTLGNAANTVSEDALLAAQKFSAFVSQVDAMVRGLVTATAQLTTVGIQNARQFQEAGQTLAASVTAGLLAAAGINAAVGGVPQVMSSIVQSVINAVYVINGHWSGLVWSGYMFGANWVNAIINGLRSRLGDLEGLLAYIRGLFPSSPAQFGAWRELPDGAAVGGAFVGDLAGALGAGRVEGALAGLHGLFGGMGIGGSAGMSGLGGSGGQSIQVTINNPVGEPAEASLMRSMRNLAAVGVI